MDRECMECGAPACYRCETCGPICDSCIEHCNNFGHDWEDE